MKKKLGVIMAVVLVALAMAQASPVNAQWQGIVARQAAKQGAKMLGKALGKNFVNRGSETTCLFGPFVCAKTAKAPGVIQPRGPQVAPVQPRGPQRFTSPRR